MTARLLVGDCRAILPTLPERSVHCVVTSPPYFGLRDYGTAQWDGGDAGCDHTGIRRLPQPDSKQATSGGSVRDPISRDCVKCGAVRIDQQIGLEGSLEDYVTTLVAVFREVRRVLRDDGCVFLNLGDSYASAWPCNRRNIVGNGSLPNGKREARPPRLPGGLKEKDLMMVPARVALALQADGWYLRSDIIWAKPNPMPESVTDRPTSAHEHVFLLTKKPRYFYDAEAVREPATNGERFHGGYLGSGNPTQVSNGRHRESNETTSRNLRNVWMIATQPYPDAHFATFPPALVEPCIKAGTSEKGCCPACGAPWVRVVERAVPPVVADSTLDRYGNGTAGVHRKVGGQYQKWLDENPAQTIGWQPSCHCDAGTPIPCTVLDPFAGAGTVGLVADRLGRDSILIELSTRYAAMAAQRIRGDSPLFATVTTE